MNKINFENAPSTNTPLSAENLNLMQDNIEEGINNSIETITNENGTAIKYSDGTMICRGRFTLASQIATAFGGGFYRYLAVDKPFPVEFIEQPTINATPVGEWVMIGTVRCDKSTISNITFFTFNADTTSKDYVTDYIAIGRWK